MGQRERRSFVERLGAPKGATAAGALGDIQQFFGLNCRLIKKFDFIRRRNFWLNQRESRVEGEIRRHFVIGAGLFCFDL